LFIKNPQKIHEKHSHNIEQCISITFDSDYIYFTQHQHILLTQVVLS